MRTGTQKTAGRRVLPRIFRHLVATQVDHPQRLYTLLINRIIITPQQFTGADLEFRKGVGVGLTACPLSLAWQPTSEARAR